MAEVFTNLAQSSSTNNPLGSGDTSLTVPTGEGARFASPTGGDFQRLFLMTTQTPGATYEIVYLTARSSDTLTITRAQDGTSAQSWASGTLVIGTPAAGTFADLMSALGSLVLIQRQDASNSSSLDFTTGIDDTYEEYELHFGNFLAATDQTHLYLRMSNDGGGTWLAGTNYRWAAFRHHGSGFSAVDSSGGNTAQIRVMHELGNASGDSSQGVIKFANLRVVASKKTCTFQSGGAIYNDDAANTNGTGIMNDTSAKVNGLRLIMATGNITSGWAALYGVRKE